MKVYLSLNPKRIPENNGIGQVVAAQWRYLPDYGLELTDDPENADVLACHIQRGNERRIDVLHLHGMYYADVPHLDYTAWNYQANASISASSREAAIITVPSEWTAETFRRDMRIHPVVIPHGIDPEKWHKKSSPLEFLLWNKGRGNDVCDPQPAWELANRKIPVISTYGPKGVQIPETMSVTGIMPFTEMKELIQQSHVYLSTTLETFGIGTLEAMASGVPVLGYNWGGTSDIVQHGENGWLVDPGDVDALEEGYHRIVENYTQMSKSARARARQFTWKNVIGRYAEVYQLASQIVNLEKTDQRVAVVIPCYNYGRWVGEAIDSCLNQSHPPDEVIVVDDGSTDNSREVILSKSSENSRVIPVFQQNAGVSAARNNGIALSSAPYIICLDADDRITPEFVKTCLTEITKNRQIGIAYTGLILIGEDGKEQFRTGWPPEFDWSHQSKAGVPPSNNIPSACMFRRSMWERAGGFRQEYAPGEDAEFWTHGLSLGFTAVKASDNAFFQYRSHGESASRTKKYVAIDDYKPWMRDGGYPFGAPWQYNVNKNNIVPVRSYLIPDVSIIVPVGPGHESYLTQAIESVIGQTERSWELIVIDDSRKTLDRSKFDRFPFIRWFETGENHGAGIARNIGIKNAKAPFSFFLDADDYLMPDALAVMLAEIKKHDCGYVYGGWYLIDNKGRFEKHAAKLFDQNEWRMQNPVSVLMYTAYAKENPFDETLPSWEDWDFFLKLSVNGVCGWAIPEVVLVYRLDSGMRRMLMIDQAGEINNNGQVVLAELKNRYGRYFIGEDKMTPCCGGNAAGQEILKIKRRFNQSAPVEQPAEQSVTEERESTVTMENPNARVRMEFIGTATAPVSYRVSGRVYRGCNNQFDRFVDVIPVDVEHLELTGAWRRVNRGDQPRPPAFVSEVPKAEPRPINQEIDQAIAQRQVTAAEAQRKAQAELSRIKTEAFSTVEAVSKKEDMTVAKALRDIAKSVHVEEPELDESEAPKKNKGGRPKKTGKPDAD